MDDSSRPDVSTAAQWVRDAARVVVLTGAGVAAESGVPVFRGPEGMWRHYRPEDLATPEAFARQPDLVCEWYSWRRARIGQAAPNAGHRAVAQLQQHQHGVTLLTQNVDGLHARAGSAPVVELHGNLWRVRCGATCSYRTTDSDAGPARVDWQCTCGARLRPDVVWFGESLDATLLTTARRAVEEAEVVLVVGTSAVVYPVADLPRIASASGARVVEINIADTPLTRFADAVLRGPSADVLPRVLAP